MFDIIVRHLARVFVDASHVQVSGSSFTELITLLGDHFIPRPIMELTPTGATVQRLGAVDITGEWAVTVTSESIDVVYSPRVGTSGDRDFENFCNRASRDVFAVQRMLGLVGYRIATVREGFGNRSRSQLDALGSRLVASAPGLTDQMFEWDWRAATKVSRDFSGAPELTNTIGILKRVEVNFPGQEPVDKLLISTDVNTPPKNRAPRFSPEQARDFVLQSALWHGELEGVLTTLTVGN